MIRHNGTILFENAELACKATGMVSLATGFADKLAALRMAFGRPMLVTSCCRSQEHNNRIGGHPRSLHIWDTSAHGLDGTAAIDIWISDPRDRGPLVVLAWEMGWSIGVARSFVHLDRRDLAGLKQMMFGY